MATINANHATSTSTDESQHVIYETQNDHNHSEAQIKVVHTVTFFEDIAIYHEVKENKYTIRPLPLALDHPPTLYALSRGVYDRQYRPTNTQSRQ
jgi:hypothetical protein